MYNEEFKNENNIRDVNIVQYVNIVQCVKRKVGYSQSHSVQKMWFPKI